MKLEHLQLPKEGLEGFKQYWKEDMLSGFLVFLLALPLSLGIAKASEFPAAMGLLTAIIGGVVVSFFAGSRLTIKGPAAGLIVIVAGAVTEFGGGQAGWKLALGTIVVAGLIQILFGVFKLGSLSDFFPASAVHGMLAAIGIIIFAKQIYVLLGIDASYIKGLGPLELLAAIPQNLTYINPSIAIIGLMSLLIVFGFPMIKNKIIKRIPSPIVVLAISIPLAIYFDLHHTGPGYSLVKIGNFMELVTWNVDFSGFKTFVFLKYVVMFALVGTIESLLTVKAMDSLDPYRRKSNSNKDLIAVGIGNTISGMLGGLAMISEVARSSANIANGARTRWANFWHGVFLLIAVILITPFIEMIPNASLAALLIGVGYRLASPKEFFKTYKIGPEQLIIFVATIVATLATDLLIGIFTGMLVKFITHIIFGVPVKSLFKANVDFQEKSKNVFYLKIKDAAIFSNYLGVKKYLERLPRNSSVTLDFSQAIVVDHTFMEHIHTLEKEMLGKGGNIESVGLESHRHISDHPLASRRLVKSENGLKVKGPVILSARQKRLDSFAKIHGYKYSPAMVLNVEKYKPFNFSLGNTIKSEENIIKGTIFESTFEFSDMLVEESQRLTKYQYKVTKLLIIDIEISIPEFTLEEEGFIDNLIDLKGGKDINFPEYPLFSKRFLLKGNNEEKVRKFFKNDLVQFLEKNPTYNIEVANNKIFIYKEPSILSTDEIGNVLKFAETFMNIIRTPVMA